MQTIEHRRREIADFVGITFLLLLALMLTGCTSLLDHNYQRLGSDYKKNDTRNKAFYTIPPKD